MWSAAASPSAVLLVLVLVLVPRPRLILLPPPFVRPCSLSFYFCAPNVPTEEYRGSVRDKPWMRLKNAKQEEKRFRKEGWHEDEGRERGRGRIEIRPEKCPFSASPEDSQRKLRERIFEPIGAAPGRWKRAIRGHDPMSHRFP